MKIYTKKGDTGETSVLSGQRVSKASKIICICGDLDELSSSLGVVRGYMSDSSDKGYRILAEKILEQQINIKNIGSEVSCSSDENLCKYIDKISDQNTKSLEEDIDFWESKMTVLNTFLYPGETFLSSLVHLTRTICRRVERNIVEYAAENEVNPEILKYLNRLSDWLFVLARMVNIA
jgi:cob(I)alamin adenosyltransferase